MKNKLTSILIALVLAIPTVTMISCEKNFDEQDSDLIRGKWRNIEILNTEGATESDLMGYIEFAPYNYIFDKREYKSVNFIYDSTQDKPYIRRSRIGHYTLHGDTLIIKDYKLQERTYIIQYIRHDSLCYMDDINGALHTFVRYDGSLDNGKAIQDDYDF